MADQQTRTDKCPHCGYGAERKTALGPKPQPEPGDPSICWKCAGLSVFGSDLKPVKPSEDDIAAIKNQPGLWEQIQFFQKEVRSRSAINN